MGKLETVKSLAQLFGKHQNTIYRWIVNDRLFPNAFRVKDGWFVPESDVRRLMRDGRLALSDGTMGGNARAAHAGGGFVRGYQR